MFRARIVGRHLVQGLLALASLCVGVLIPVNVSSGQSAGQGPAEIFAPKTWPAIDKMMRSAVEEEQIVGCNSLVWKDGQECFYQGWGRKDRDDPTPLGRDTIFRIYSMSKPITSVATMQLVEQGKLKLDDPVSEYLPEFAGLRVSTGSGAEETEPARRPMTIRDLLRHTSGLTYGFLGRSDVDQLYRRNGILLTDPDLASMVTKLGQIPLKHQPGARFEYSCSTDVLGRVIEIASGERFDRYLAGHLFAPLKMKDTYFTVPTEKLDRLAALYRPGDDGALSPSPRITSRRFVWQDNRFFSGGGGLCSTIDDYLNFSRMLIQEGKFGGNVILQPESLKEMYSNQLAEIDRSPGRGFQFGLGFRITPQRRGTDYGWGGAAGTRFWVNPEEQLIVLYMIQINPYGQRSFGNQVRRIVYDGLQ